jgi:hypothetical protein
VGAGSKGSSSTLDAPLRVDTEGRISVPGTILLESGRLAVTFKCL